MFVRSPEASGETEQQTDSQLDRHQAQTPADTRDPEHQAGGAPRPIQLAPLVAESVRGHGASSPPPPSIALDIGTSPPRDNPTLLGYVDAVMQAESTHPSSAAPPAVGPASQLRASTCRAGAGTAPAAVMSSGPCPSPSVASSVAAARGCVKSRGVLLKQRVTVYKPAELLTHAQCEDALRTFTELTKLDSRDVAAHNGRGDCLRILDDSAGAFWSYIAALNIDANNAQALYGCGLVLKSQERLQDAITYLSKAVAADPNFADARRLLATTYTDFGTCLKSVGQTEQGTLCYGKATDVDPTYAAAHYNLGVVHGECGDGAAAMRCYELALQHQPGGYCEAYCNIGERAANPRPPARAPCHPRLLATTPAFQSVCVLAYPWSERGGWDRASEGGSNMP